MGGQRVAVSERISIGNTSEVWRWSHTTVVKVLQPGIPRSWAAQEADITAKVHAAGLPVPATEGIVVVDGRPGVVFEHVDGASMWDHMKASPAELPSLADAMVGLQADVHAATAEGIPDLVTRLHAKIGDASQLPPEDRREAGDLLASLPTGSSLCHGDMHPRNILMSSRGMVIVDWFDAAVGNHVADFVRSSLLMRPPSVEPLTHLDGASGEFLGRLHHAYLAILARRGLVPEARFGAWEAVLAVARMSEPVPTADLVRIWQSRRRSAAN